MDNRRPKLGIKLTLVDRIIEYAGLFALVFMVTLIIWQYPELPDQIPIHYNLKGEVTNYGGKGFILLIPVISVLMFAGLTLINKYPHLFNYPVKINENNALRQYTNAARFIRSLKLIFTLIFTMIMYESIQTAVGETDGLGFGFPFTPLALIFTPVIYYLIKSIKDKG